MSFEIEIKAHVEPDQVEQVKAKLEALPAVNPLGEEEKTDVYWARTEEEHPLFRTRFEGNQILFTSKPVKSYSNVEVNQEIEFVSPVSEWDNCHAFFESLGFVVCRQKHKKGWHFDINHEGYHVHAELLDVRYLGWFLEMEICPPSLDDFDLDKATNCLKQLLTLVGLSQEAIEPKGYNRMLREIAMES